MTEAFHVLRIRGKIALASSAARPRFFENWQRLVVKRFAPRQLGQIHWQRLIGQLFLQTFPHHRGFRRPARPTRPFQSSQQPLWQFQRDGRHGPSVIRRPSPRNTRCALPSSSFAFASAVRPYQRLSRKSIKSEDRHRHARRRQRIAKGSGVSVTELNTMLNRFSQMQQMMKKMGKFQKMMARMGGGAAGLMRRR